MLETILKIGKRTLIPLAISTIIGCLPATYAQRDYGQYPAYKSEIAFYNIKQISKDICSGTEIDSSSFKCRITLCAATQTVYNSGGGLQTPTSTTICTGYKTDEYSFNFSDVKRINQKDREVKIELNGKEPQTIPLKNSRQAFDFAEALDIYIKERR